MDFNKELNFTGEKTERDTSFKGHLFLVAGMAAIILSGCKENTESKPSKANTTETRTVKDPAAEFFSTTPMRAPLRFPKKPYSLGEMPGNTLDEKMKNFILERANAGDPTMMYFQDSINTKREVRFMTSDEASNFLQQIGKADTTRNTLYGARVIDVSVEERKDDIARDLSIVDLTEDGLGEKQGRHKLAGVLTNEMTGVFIRLGSDGSVPQHGKIRFVGQQVEIPEWVISEIAFHLLHEALSSIADEMVEERTATNNPRLYRDGENLWQEFCKSLQERGTFTPSLPAGYAKIYFGLQVKAMLGEKSVQMPQIRGILQTIYQNVIQQIVTNPQMKEIGFMAGLRKLRVIQ